MSTYTFSNRTVQSDGITTKIVNNGIEQTFTPNRYTVSTPLTDTTYTNGNFHQYAETRNIDVLGNSQENYAGRGVTSEYNVKIVGSPDMFSGNAQRGADKALSQLVGVLLQQGDDRNFAPGNPMGEIDLKSVTSSMASSWQTAMCPTLSPIRELSDIPVVLGELVAWGEGIKIADAAEQAAKAAAYELERQAKRVQENIEANIKALGETFGFSEESTANPATDERAGNYNITEAEVMDAFLDNMPAYMAYTKQI